MAVISARGTADMKCYGTEGDGEGFFCRPQGVAIDSEGHILVCDSRNNRIQVTSFLVQITPYLSHVYLPFIQSVDVLKI